MLKTSRNGLQFFAHKYQGDCTTAVESRQHLALKAIAVEVIRECGWNVQTEVAGATPEGESWVADVLATKGQVRVAVEIQWSPQTEDQTAFRQERYRRSGVRAMWLLHQPNFPVEREIPAVCVREEDDKSFTAMIPHGRGWNARARSRPDDWAEQMSVQEVLRAAFEGRLWYGHIRPGTRVHAKLLGGFVKCWNCNDWTNLLYEIELVPECAGSDPARVQFDQLTDELLPLLIPNSLRGWKVGEIKPRFSKTRGKSYLSNGCVHCDALQGSFFHDEIKHRLKPITEYSLSMSEELAMAVNEYHRPRWRIRVE